MESGPVFRHELAGAITALEVALGQEPSLVAGHYLQPVITAPAVLQGITEQHREGKADGA